MHVSVIVALYSSETWPNRYLVINDRSKRRDLRQAMNNIENGHRLHQRQAPPSYSDAMPIVLQNAPPSYDEVMHNVSAYNMNPHKAANEGNDAQNVLEQINLTSSNLRQVTVSYNHPDSATDNLLPQTEINYTQQSAATFANRPHTLSGYQHPNAAPETPNVTSDINRNRNKEAGKRTVFIITCCCVAVVVILITVKKTYSYSQTISYPVEILPCLSSPCKNGGSCTNSKSCSRGTCSTAYSCSCRNGFYGTNCDFVIMRGLPNANELPCLSSPCRNGGSCSNSESCSGGACTTSYSCSCPYTYYGTHCDFVTDPCSSSPCENGGTCKRMGAWSYVCNCPDCCTGTRCEVRKGCLSNPCKNGGLCNDVYRGVYYCSCSSDFMGQHCERNISELRPV